MAEVTLNISGKNYRVACDDGQEEHLIGLGQVLDGKINEMRGSFGDIGDMRLTVMAAIVLADDLAEANKKLARLQSDDETAVAASESDSSEAVVVLDRLSERLEILAADLRGHGRETAGA